MPDQEPRRFKGEDELTIEERFQRLRAERRGDPPPSFETDEYRAHQGAQTTARPLDELTVQDHIDRIYGKDQ